jgi:hypothetical protein
MNIPQITHHYVDVDGLNVFYREAGSCTAFRLHRISTAG